MVESGCNFLHAYIYIYNCKKIWIDKDKDVENIFQNNVVFFHHEYLIYIYIYIYIYYMQTIHAKIFY